PPPPALHALSLHDALPISWPLRRFSTNAWHCPRTAGSSLCGAGAPVPGAPEVGAPGRPWSPPLPGEPSGRALPGAGAGTPHDENSSCAVCWAAWGSRPVSAAYATPLRDRTATPAATLTVSARV